MKEKGWGQPPMLLFPVVRDVERHGSENILWKSGQDILTFKWVMALNNLIGTGVRATTRVVLSAIAAMLAIVLSGYALLAVVAHIIRSLLR